MRRITLAECEAEGACRRGLDWGRETFKGRSFTVADVLKHGKWNYADWLMDTFYYPWAYEAYQQEYVRIEKACPASQSAFNKCTCTTKLPAALIKLLQGIDP